jgi:parallel beta-helix repeat protein
MRKNFFILMLWVNALLAQNNVQFGHVEAIPGINSIGITAEIIGDQNSNAKIELRYRSGNNADWKSGHPVSRISAEKFAGSLFRLPENEEFEIELRLQDADGIVGNSSYAFGSKTLPGKIPEYTGGQKIYVAPNGRDSNSGSKSAPFQTIQHAVNVALPGDEVHVLPGTYREYVEVERGGAPDKYLKIMADGEVVLDGSAPGFEVDASDNWTLHQNPGIFGTPIGWEPCYVYADGQQLFRYNSLEELSALRAGSPGGWVYLNQTLYVCQISHQDPDEIPMQISQLEAAFYLKKVAYVSVEGFDIRHYGNSVYGKGIYLRNVSHCVIRNNQIHQVYTGIWLKGAESDYNLIESNYLWDTTIYSWPWDDVKGSYHEGAAISLEAGKGNIVRQNEIEGFFNGITIAFWDDLFNPLMNQSVVISDNKIHHILDDCIEPEGTCCNLQISDNEMYECTVGVSLAPITLGPVFVVRNRISDFLLTSFKFSSNTSGPCFIYHNTAITTKENTNGIVSSGPWKNMIFKNNIIAGTCYAIEDHELAGDTRFDFDNLYTSDPSRFVKWKDKRYYSATEFYQGAHQEEHGFSEMSRFVDLKKRDFKLQANCPNIDKGIRIPNINDDFTGQAPDLGAFEYEPTAEISVAAVLPRTPILLENYPNPFNNQLIIAFTLPRALPVRLAIFNTLGQLVAVLEEKVKPAGAHQIRWAPENLVSGVYWLHLQAGSEQVIRSCTLLK